jgi:hypothetical protein
MAVAMETFYEHVHVASIATDHGNSVRVDRLVKEAATMLILQQVALRSRLCPIFQQVALRSCGK